MTDQANTPETLGSESMTIARVEAIPLVIPFTHGGLPAGFGGRIWDRLPTLLVRVEAAGGLIGYGDAFAYNCLRPVQAALEDMVAPLAIGRDARDIAGLNEDLQRALHLFGRYGITLFALSGLDIALWDLAGKAAGKSLRDLLGPGRGTLVPGYASLFRYGDPELVAQRCARALAEGYGAIKLHETAAPMVAAAREVAGADLPLMLDTNCPWSLEEALAACRALKPFGLTWLEEPLFPPEDYPGLARLGHETGIAIAAGENASTVHDFAKMFAAKAVAYAQPSVTKVGGITEFLKVCAAAEAAGVKVMPHSPYFGPGFLATLHLVAGAAPEGLPGALVERFHLDLEASLYGDAIDPTADGSFMLPAGPGLGRDPDPAVVQAYRLQ